MLLELESTRVYVSRVLGRSSRSARARSGGSLPGWNGRLVDFDILEEISEVETIAVGHAIRGLDRLQKQYGKGRWRKMKGIALIRLRNGRVRKAELHWYEAHGDGR